MASSMPVALYIPNLMGYLRILLAFVGLHICLTHPVTAVYVWLVSASLDLLDGIVARRLQQTSSYGILLDICADNFLRTCVWIAAIASGASASIPCFLISIEWFTMVATQLHAASYGSHWKSQRGNDPWLVRNCFANNFRSPIGLCAIYGLFTSNMWTFASRHPSLYETIPYFHLFRWAAYVGRAVALCVEMWLCQSYLSMIIAKDTEQRKGALHWEDSKQE